MKLLHYFLFFSIFFCPILQAAKNKGPAPQKQFKIISPNKKNIITIEGKKYFSNNFESRAPYTPSIVVLHYTAKNLEKSALALTFPLPGVSAHYLVPEYLPPQKAPHPIYNLVREEHTAFHAGVSQWRQQAIPSSTTKNPTLNPISIGIEMVNYGYLHQGDKPILDTRGNLQFIPFNEQQIKVVIELCKELKKRWNIKPWNWVGHSDIALPAAGAKVTGLKLRKYDPGAAFVWQKLAREGIGMWPGIKAPCMAYEKPHGYDLIWTKKALERVGYCIIDKTNTLDTVTAFALAAFRLHYQPEAFNYSIPITQEKTWNSPAAEKTQAILYSLIAEYGIPALHYSIFNKDMEPVIGVEPTTY